MLCYVNVMFLLFPHPREEAGAAAMSMVITLRSLRRDELGLVVKWTAAEGWHVSENMLASCWAQDPAGFMAAEDDRHNVVGKTTL